MDGKKIKIIAYIIIGIFILSIVYFISSIYINSQKGSERAEVEFSIFIEEINTLLSSGAFFNGDYIQGLQNNVINNSRVAAVILYVENEAQFAYPVSSGLIAANDTGIPDLQISSPRFKIFSETIPMQQGQSVVIKAAVYTLHPDDIFNSARLSFFIIFACTLTVILLLSYLTLSSKTQSMTIEVPQEEPAYTEEEQIETIPIMFRNTDEYNDDFPETDIETTEDEIGNNDKSEFDETETYSEVAKDSEDNILAESENEAIVSDPMGLFSNITGVGWASYMETRLDAELVRAASSEQDLALILIRIKGIEENKVMLKKIATTLLDYFKFRDFVFEYKEDGFAGILLNINIDQAILLAESLYTKLISLIREVELTNTIAIGLSTRTLRHLPGSRIITEADQAVEKAFSENDLPIVAFRVNPERYRQFVADSVKPASPTT